MKHIVKWLLLSLLACATPAQVRVAPAPLEPTPWGAWVAVEAPLRGHVWIRCALPNEAPPILIGPNGIVAYRLHEIGSHGLLYGLETFADLLAPLNVPVTPAAAEGTRVALVPLREMQLGDQVPLASLHLAVVDDWAAIVPSIELGGVDLGGPTLTLEQVSAAHQRWRARWSTQAHLVEAWGMIQSRSPILDWVFVVRARDAKPVRLPVRISAGEELSLVPDGARRNEGGAIVGEVTLDFGGLDIVRARMLCRYADGHTDELTEQAIAAAQRGPWRGLIAQWPGTWTGGRVVRGSGAIGDQVAGWISAAQGGQVARPWMARDNPNNGGVDPGMGLVWSAPVWIEGRRADPRVVALVQASADTWAWRPMHWLEPGRDDLVVPPPAHAQLTMHAQQPWRAGDTLGLALPVSRKAPLRGLDPHDIEHPFAGPLAAALALTGDPALDYVARSWIADEVHERSAKAGWVQNGRAEGRTITTVLALQGVTGYRAREVGVYVRQRLEAVRTTSPGARVAFERPVHVCRLSDRGEPWRYWVAYEEAQFSWSAWVAGDAEQAYLHGRTVAAGCVWKDDQLLVGYHVRYLEGADEGMALAGPGEWHPDLKPGGAALAQWAGAGLYAFLLADAELRARGTVTRPDPYVEVARRALRDLEAGVSSVGLGEETVARHTALSGAWPELTAPVGGR